MVAACEIVPVLHDSQQEAFCTLEGLGALDASTVKRHTPDAQWLMLDHGSPAGRYSLWFRTTPPYGAHRLGFVGHFAARDQSVAGALLDHACAELRREGCSLAAAPIDGNTWRRYRLLTERGSRPVFFLEPDNPDHWPAYFTGNGFTPLARYYSAIVEHVHPGDPLVEALAARMSSQGLTVRPFNASRFTEEMRAIFQISLAAFTQNFLYSPIGEDEFMTQYAAIRPHIIPGLVLIAEWSGEPVGFAFAVPDLFQRQRCEPLDTLVFKTLAVHPRFAGRRIGSILVHRMHQAAVSHGFHHVIHALMHDQNRSTRISAHYASVFRRYVLYSKVLV